MNATFYVNNSDEKKVNKSLSTIKTIQCELKEGCSMLKPYIILDKNSLSNWARVNYMYLDIFGRYYFIDPSDIVALTGGMIQVGGRVDPLQSNISSIINLNCVVLRQEFRCNKYYQDSELQIRAEKTFIYKKVGTLPNVKNYILTVDGGRNNG